MTKYLFYSQLTLEEVEYIHRSLISTKAKFPDNSNFKDGVIIQSAELLTTRGFLASRRPLTNQV